MATMVHRLLSCVYVCARLTALYCTSAAARLRPRDDAAICRCSAATLSMQKVTRNDLLRALIGLITAWIRDV
ncbi:uncharacterized protein B0I36DRAFT_110560 [Microdochium trichocladiopsis]|uniref:Secreted protein n=1 Tax=Microdochium trichocladiopsis TaxID=1682393 RepID=A0A9P8YC30_9PEZI|nr:uncharacterized protein B0I36DRAFT_110560 [Microdochium trichocladiopsis]KAH7033569.1 hypothetical protein B0I36DRAFT_110560 [Microdochium trichocladiopsis]